MIKSKYMLMLIFMFIYSEKSIIMTERIYIISIDYNIYYLPLLNILFCV